MRLSQYAAANPMPEPIETNTERNTIMEQQQRRADMEAADRLKQSISEQLQRGATPEIILYSAIKCIGLYSNDPDYITACTGHLDSIWGDLAQQSMLQDNAAIAAQKLRDKQEAYNIKLRNTLNRQKAAYSRLMQDFDKALTELDELEGLDQTK